MPCKTKHSFGMWLAIAVAIAAASMSSSKPRKADHVGTTTLQASPRITLTLPLN
jgi:hypothetical protein